MGKQCGWPIMCGLYYNLHRVIRSKTEERSHVEFTIPNNSKTFNYICTMIIQITVIRLSKNEYSCQKQEYIPELRIIPNMLLNF